MSQNRKPLDLQETSDLVPLRPESGAYSFVSSRRSKRQAAVIVAEPLSLEFEDDVPTQDIRPLTPRGTAPPGTIQAAIERMLAEDGVQEEDVRVTREFRPAPKRAPYRDPELCACAKLTAAFGTRVVMVVVAGPVTLAPAVMREEALLGGGFDLDGIERAYDGKPWAFRHCPFGGCLIDDQVEALPRTDAMSCCGTMALAVEHGRVELPEPTRFDRGMAKFTDAGRAALLFTRCPWCATEMIDLVLERHKRHRGITIPADLP